LAAAYRLRCEHINASIHLSAIPSTAVVHQQELSGASSPLHRTVLWRGLGDDTLPDSTCLSTLGLRTCKQICMHTYHHAHLTKHHTATDPAAAAYLRFRIAEAIRISTDPMRMTLGAHSSSKFVIPRERAAIVSQQHPLTKACGHARPCKYSAIGQVRTERTGGTGGRQQPHLSAGIQQTFNMHAAHTSSCQHSSPAAYTCAHSCSSAGGDVAVLRLEHSSASVA
jgi:hypothetical protein